MVPARLQRDLPPTGELKRRNVYAGSKVWAMKTTLLGVWVKATVLSVRSTQEPIIYKVRFDNYKTLGPKVFNGKNLAYMTPSEVSVPVGTRIIAVCNLEMDTLSARYTDEFKSHLYAGIVAEPPKVTNRGRYLIFFDDGYAQYVYHEDVFVVLSQSNDVADDIHEDLRDFMRAYLAKYPERPMVKLQVGQITKTELSSHWRETVVEEVDASMIKMKFLDIDRTEWLYRGSTRLKLLYNELANAELSRLSRKNRRHNIIPRRHQDGYVEYTNENETNDDIVTIDSEDEEDMVKSRFPRRKTGGSQYMTEETKPIRNTARKSTCQLANAQNAKNKDKSISSFPRDVKSHLGHKDRIRFDSYTRIKYVPHSCNIGCREEEDPDKYRGRNPLLIPMYLGW
ncbi:Histone-lysine N-methyltransferase SETDB1-B, partial [Stegodyphus mimosarum]